LDLERGDCVLEAGTGNGSLTLYLARAVAGQGSAGDPGRVDTFDIRENHRRQAERNVCNFARGTYTATVRFHDGSLSTLVADETASECSYDGAVLDMPAPHHELETVAKYLKNDRFLVCYLPNITQVVDLLRYIKINQLPFAMEDCVDVIIQEWEVRSTTIRSQPDPTLADNIDQTWVCRPKNFDVKGHTAYLVKLRKCVNIECHPTSPIVSP
jgi:tRNA (adenine57-N1/adenine58-N1)-methyltransferase